MVAYFIQVTFYWGIFYLVYLLLRKETFFKANRAYLLATFLGSLIIPLFDFTGVYPTEPVFLLDTVTIGIGGVGTQLSEEASRDEIIPYFIFAVFVAGVLISLTRLGAGIWRISQLIRTGELEHQDKITIVSSSKIQSPFSFFKWLFTSRESFGDEETWKKVYLHESAHIKQWHSLDVIILEVVGIFFWWNPLIIVYKKSLKNVHEYLADAEVLRTTGRQVYGEMLIRQSIASLLPQPQPQESLANYFFHSQLRKRIEMITRRKSGKTAALKYLLLLPALVLAILACNQQPPHGSVVDETSVQSNEANEDAQVDEVLVDTLTVFDPETNSESTRLLTTNVYKVVDVLPVMKGCEHLKEEERTTCSNKKQMEFIGYRLKYPDEAKQKKIEGTVIASFIVDHRGRVFNEKIVKGLGHGCDEEVLRILQEMPDWIPGEKEGKAVHVKLLLPVRFSF